MKGVSRGVQRGDSAHHLVAQKTTLIIRESIPRAYPAKIQLKAEMAYGCRGRGGNT